LVVLALSFVSLACWSFADPLVAAPDEQAHVLHADALDHGQEGAQLKPPSKVLVNVTLPTSIVYTVLYPICWHQHMNIAATCSKAWPTSQAPEQTPIYVAHYPPLYYLFVGTASYVSQQRAGVFLMRLISGLMGSLMLATAAYAIARWSRRRVLFMGLYVALAPEAYFLSSSVNPGGFEIMTAICLWTLVAIFALEHREDPPRDLVILLGIVASTLVLIRGLSPLWVALAGGSLVVIAGARNLYDQLLRRRDMKIAAGSVVVATLLAVTWTFTQGTLNILPVGVAVPKNASTLSILRMVMSFVQGWLRETVGILGWLDTELPNIVYQSWYLIVIGVLVVALVRGNWRERGVVVALSALTVVIPVALVTRQARTLGIVWQGRDSMPLAVGAVIMAIAVGSQPAKRRAQRAIHAVDPVIRQRIGTYVPVAVVAVLAVANMLSFYTNLRRYAVGRYGPKLFFLHNLGWSPPTGQFATLLVYCLVTTAFSGVLIAWMWFLRSPVAQK
jgi:hypothetical protein